LGTGVISGVIVGLPFYRLSRRDVEGLRNYFAKDLMPYESRLKEALTLLEGKVVEGEGRIVVDHDDNGNPLRVRIAPTKTIRGGSIPSEEVFGEPTIEIGPPPKPPRIVELSGHIGGRSSMSGTLTVTRPSWWRRILARVLQFFFNP